MVENHFRGSVLQAGSVVSEKPTGESPAQPSQACPALGRKNRRMNMPWWGIALIVVAVTVVLVVLGVSLDDEGSLRFRMMTGP